MENGRARGTRPRSPRPSSAGMHGLRGAAIAVVCGLAQSAAAAPPAEAPARRDALRLEQRLAHALARRDAGPAIDAYRARGLIGRHPDERVDYTDYHMLKRPAGFLGHALVLIEQEYFHVYVGCCFSPGAGVVVRLEGDARGLRQFAAARQCRLDTGPELRERHVAFGLGLVARPGRYAALSCRERDRAGNEEEASR